MYIEKRGGIIMNKMKRVLASVFAVTLLAQTALVSGGMQVDAFFRETVTRRNKL